MEPCEKFLLHSGQILFLASVTATTWGHLHANTFRGDLTFDYGLLGMGSGIWFICSAIWLSLLSDGDNHQA